ncbi:hypothetical protein A3709_19605 [Halioglobus sp. HI00S01]|nr:hypothetical protein A3709_19605 [Halioglobus sp. HI00S01]
MLRLLQFITLVLVLGCGCSFNAFAQPATPPQDPQPTAQEMTEVAPDDLSVELLTRMFGSVTNIGLDVGAIPETPDSLIGTLLEIVSTLCLYFVFIIVTWLSVVGLVNTGADGEVLGKSYSTEWIPLRLLTSVALLFPVAGGFNSIQIAILWIAMQGVGGANYVWNAALEYTQENRVLVAASTADDAEEAAATMFRGSMCAHGINVSHGMTDCANGPGEDCAIAIDKINRDSTKNIRRQGNGRVNYTPANLFDTWGANYSGEDRGFAAVAASGFLSTFGFGTRRVNYPSTACGGWTVETYKPEEGPERGPAEDYYKSLQDGLFEMQEEMDTIAKGVVNSSNNRGSINPELTAGEIYDSIAAYKTKHLAAQEALRVALSDIDISAETKTNPRAGGWITAGAYYNIFARASKQYYRIAEIDVATEKPRGVEDNDDYADKYAPLSRAVLNAAASSDLMRSRVAEGQSMVLFTDSETTDSEAVLETGLSFLMDALNETENSPDPVAAASSWARAGINWGSWMWLALKGIEGALEVATAAKETIAGDVANKITGWGMVVAGLQAALDTALTWFTAIALFSLPFLGALAYYLPLIPFIYWTIAVVGWVTMLFESLVAGSFWAVTFATPDGTGPISERAKAGFLIILTVFLKPITMIIALIGTIYIMQFAMSIYFLAFIPALRDSIGTSFSSFFQLAATIAIFAIVVVTTAHRVYELIPESADRVFRFVGNSREMLGEQQVEGASRTAFGAAAGAGAAAAGADQGSMRLRNNNRRRGPKGGSEGAGDGAAGKGKSNSDQQLDS